MRYSREVALTFESIVEEDLDAITKRIKAAIAKELSGYNIGIRITKNGFYPDQS